MNIFDLLESPGMGRPRDTKGIQSADDQRAASVIGSGTTKRESKKKPVTMMGMNVKESSAHDNFKKSVKDRGYDMDAGAKRLEDLLAKQKREREERERAEQGNEVKEAHPNQQMSIYNPDGPTYRQEKMPGYDVDDIFSRGTAVDYDPEGGDINAPEDHLDAAEKANLKKILKQYMDKLSPVERNVLMMRYYQDHTLESAGVILGVTPERVRQIEARAMRKIRQFDKGTTKDLLGLSQKRTDEGILDRGVPKMPKPRNPANAVLGNKVNAAGKHLDKKRRQDLNPKHKHKDPLAESTGQLNWTIHFDDGTSQQVTVPSDEFDVRGYFAKRGKKVVKIDYSFAAQDRQDAPRRGTDDPAAGADSLAKAQSAYDRGLTEQEVEEEFRLGKKLGTRRDRFKSLRKRKEGILGEVDVDETIRKVGSQYRLLSKKGKNLGTFDSKAGAEKHEREVQYFKHKDMEEGIVGTVGFPDDEGTHTGNQPQISLGGTFAKRPEVKEGSLVKVDGLTGVWRVERIRGDAADVTEEIPNTSKSTRVPVKDCRVWTNKPVKEQDVAEGWKGKVAGAALAGAAALGGGDVDAQNIDLPGPQVSYVAHVTAEANGREVHRTVNLGGNYSSEQEAYDDIERSLQSKGITRYNINIEQRYDAQYYPGSNQPRGGTATGRDYGTPGIGDMVIKHIGREIRAGIPSKGGYATGGTNRGERPRDGSQWWRDQLPQMREDALAEDIESHLYLMSRAGYDIVQEEWSDKYKRSINCSNPKGFSQKAHCAGKKKNEGVAEGKSENPSRRGFLKALAVAAVLSSTPVAKLMSDATSKMSIVKHRGKLGKYQGSDIDCTGYKIGKKQFYITVDGEPYTVQTGTGAGFMGQDFKNLDFKSDTYLQKIAPWLNTKDEYILQIADYDIELYDQNNQKIFPAKDQQQTKEMYSNGFIDAIIGYLDVYQTSAIQRMAEVPSEPHYPEELPAIDKGSKGVSAIASKAAGNDPLHIARLASLAKRGYDAITKKPDAQQSAPSFNAPAALPAPSDDNVLRPELNKQKEKSSVKRRGVDEDIERYVEALSRAGYEVTEEKVRLDPKCWSGKKIGNPKTKMKGGVRVNNCVPK